MTPVKFIEAVDSYFVYSANALFTKVHEFIELFRNNNTVLGCLAVDTWQPGDTVSVGMIKRSPNMPAGVAAKATAGGETSTTEPTWPTTGTVSDGGVVWKMIPQSGMETATQAEVTTGTDTEKAVTPATAAGCYMRTWQGTTAPTDLTGRTMWMDTNTDPAQLKYYNVSKSAWQSAVANAAKASAADNANYVNNESITDYIKNGLKEPWKKESIGNTNNGITCSDVYNSASIGVEGNDVTIRSWFGVGFVNMLSNQGTTGKVTLSINCREGSITLGSGVILK